MKKYVEVDDFVDAVAICDACGEKIYYGEAYLTLERSVEKRHLLVKKQKDKVEVFEGGRLWLCSKCAVHISEKALKAYVRNAGKIEPDYSYQDKKMGQK